MKFNASINSTILRLTVLFILIINLNGCKKNCECNDPSNSECKNYNPCHNKSNVAANFEAMAYLHGSSFNSYPEQLLKVDTVYLSSNLLFEANDKSYMNYKWIIGSDPNHRSGNKISVSFVLTEEETIPITLIVQGSPDKNCQNKLDYRDTFTKYIHFMPYKKFSLNGVFEGVFLDSPDKTVQIDIVTEFNGIKGYIKGLPVNSKEPPLWFGDTAVQIISIINTYAYFDNEGARNQPQGVVSFNQTKNELNLELKVIEPYPLISGQNLTFKQYNFKGKKIK